MPPSPEVPPVSVPPVALPPELEPPRPPVPLPPDTLPPVSPPVVPPRPPVVAPPFPAELEPSSDSSLPHEASARKSAVTPRERNIGVNISEFDTRLFRVAGSNKGRILLIHPACRDPFFGDLLRSGSPCCASSPPRVRAPCRGGMTSSRRLRFGLMRGTRSPVERS